MPHPFNRRMWRMIKMLTAKDIQELLQVDRSTIYRMAEAGQLPAIKVGRQWRFPADQIADWFQAQTSIYPNSISGDSSPPSTAPADLSLELADLVPQKWLQTTQNIFADLLGVMLVVTDMEGEPLTDPSFPCGLFTAIREANTHHLHSWRDVVAILDLTPKFYVTHLDLLCTRSLIVVGTEIKGAVIAGCIAPDGWPPPPDEITAMAVQLGVSPEVISRNAHEIYVLDETQREQVLTQLPRIAAIIAYMASERKSVISRIEAIADLARLDESCS